MCRKIINFTYKMIIAAYKRKINLFSKGYSKITKKIIHAYFPQKLIIKII